MVLGMAPMGEEDKAVEFLTKFWQNLHDADLFESWPWGLIEGLLYQPGLMNGTPFERTLHKIVANMSSEEFHRKLVINVADLNTGKTDAKKIRNIADGGRNRRTSSDAKICKGGWNDAGPYSAHTGKRDCSR